MSHSSPAAVLNALRILSALLLVVLAGCRGKSREGEVVFGGTSLPVSFEVVGAGSSARVAVPLEAAVYDAQAWDTLRARLTFARPARPVDFTGAMLLIAAADVPSSGHALRFESVEQDSAGTVVTYTLFKPGGDCLTDALPQQPFQVVRLQRLEGPVRFVREDVSLPCEVKLR